MQAKPSNQLKRKAEEAVPAEELKKAAKTGPLVSSPRRKVAVVRTQTYAKATASGAAPSKKVTAGRDTGEMCQENLGRDYILHMRMLLFHCHTVESMRPAAREQRPQAKAAASKARPLLHHRAGDTDMQ